MNAVRSLLVVVAIGVYRALLYLYPAAHRRRFARSMEETFAELCRERLRGPVSALGIALAEYPSLVRRAAAERLGVGLARAPGRVDSRPASRGRGPSVAARWLGGTRQDLLQAGRMFRHRPTFAIVVIVTLTLGIGLNTALFSVLYGVLLQPLPYAEPESLVRVGRASPRGTWLNPISPAEFRELQPRLSLLEHLTAAVPAAHVLTGPEEADRVASAYATPSLFPLLGVTPQRGRFFTAADTEPGSEPLVVIGDGFWRRMLGADPAAVGSLLELDDGPFRVIGIAPPGFDFRPSGRLGGAELWLPLVWDEGSFEVRHGHHLLLFGRLAPGAGPAAVEAELQAAWEAVVAVDPGNHRDPTYEVGMRTRSLRESVVDSTREPLLFLAGAVALVLAIACVNVANLLLANADARRTERAVRTALGAGRWRLVRQGLVESAGLSLIGGGLGVLLAAGVVRTLLGRFPIAVPRAAEVGIHGPVLLFAFVASLATAVVLGALTSLQGTSGSGPLRPDARGATARATRLRGGLVIAEIALAVMLVIGAGLLLKSFWNARDADLGFATDGLTVVSLALPRDTYPDWRANVRFYRALRERLDGTPGIVATAQADMVPIREFGNNVSGVAPVDRPERRASFVEIRHVTPGYHDALEIPLVRGRQFLPHDLDDGSEAVLIDTTLARQLFGDRDPVGERLTLEPEGLIVGVVGATRAARPDREASPTVYRPAEWPTNLLVRAPLEPAALTAAIRGAVDEVDPRARVYALDPLDGIVERALGDRRFQALLVGLFAAVALSLGAVGIYGVLAYAIQSRMRDFGIRLAVGARAVDIRLLVLRGGGTLTLVGLALGLAGAVALRGWVAGLLFEVDPADPTIYGVVLVLMATVAAIACWLPARRAARADPVETLRGD